MAETILHGLFFLIYLGLALYILNKNSGALLNRTVSLLMLVTSLQSLSIMGIRYPTVDLMTANIFMDVLSVSMTAFGILAFLSMVFISGLFKPNPFIYFVLSLYLASFIVFQLKTDFAYVLERNSNGIWEVEFANPIVLTALDIIHNLLLILGFTLLFIYIRKTTDSLKRKQIKIILITGLISYSFSLLNILIPIFLDDTRMLMLNDVLLSVFLFGFIYSLVKYELFEITPSIAAEQLIEMLPSGLIIADSNENIIRINKALTEITQRPGKSFYRKNLSTVFKSLANKDTKIKFDAQDYFKHIELNTKTEKDKTVSIFYKQLHDKFGRILGSITLIHDINELIKAQELLSKSNILLEKRVEERTHELSLAKAKAEEANRLKTEFLNNMSHEIRTPMNGIIGFSQMLDQPNISNEKRKHYCKIVQNSSQQLLRIIDDILAISTLDTKQEKINETEFCLNDLLMELFSIFNLKSKERNIPLYLKKALHDDQSHLISDKTKLSKILGNLLENALKFTNEGFIEFGYNLGKTNLVLYVKDTGIGISPINHRIIFERFAQEDKEISLKHGGIGLGLSICEENAKLLGGEITLESEKGKGSTFFVSIPYKPIQKESINISESVDNKQKTSGEYTILVAEDEEVNYLYVEVLFEDEIEGNYNLIHAKNGKEAVDICMTNNSIDLVLMDIKMPIINGLEATKKIKEKFPNLPIIAQTAYSTESDKQLALKHGCNDFISKPIEKERLFKLISKHLICR